MSEHESLVREIRSALADCDDLRRHPWQGSADPVVGHCYIASEALYFMLGGRHLSYWKPMFVRVAGQPHWFLENKETGERLDVTASQFSGVTIPYSKARGKGFLTKGPSKRARELLNRIAQGRHRRGLV